MSYQVLARKWRPRSFPEMVGQEHVLRALINALDSGRLHHAFLFTGTRGVGKTTVARILAKSLNCEQGVGSQPCGECGACQDIDAGRFVDLVEVDAASRTKVEDTRELLENVAYAPSRGRYKVYLVDEVHMLSNHSFNALLKTLEEPPPHVKFLLATTDPQRLPVTILSRCLQFNLKRMPLQLIRSHLARITEAEGIAADAAALGEIARAADGSMRDALSLLDQAIAYSGGALEAGPVRDMLGTVDRQRVVALADALATRDSARLLREAAALAERAPDFAGVLNELNRLLQRVALAQAVPDALAEEDGEREAVSDLAGQLSPEDVQLYYQIGITGRRDLPLAPDPRSGFEMVLLRMLAFRPADADPGQTPGRRQAATGTAVPAPSVSEREASPPPSQPAPETAANEVRDVPSPPAGIDDWSALVATLPLNGMTRQFAMHCALLGLEGERLRLGLDPATLHLRQAKWEENLRQALESYLGRPIRLEVEIGGASAETPERQRLREAAERQQAAEQSIAEDGRLNSLLDRFDGQVVPGSVRPHDPE